MGLAALLRLYAVAWTPLVAIYAVIYVAFGTPLLAAFRSSILTILPYGVLGLLVLGLPRRVPWRDGGRAIFFAVQVALAVVYAVFGTLGWLALWTFDALLVAHRQPVRFQAQAVAWQTVIGGLIYLSVAGAAYAWWNAEQGREAAARAARADSLRTRAELAALRSQLNPHFLLNTLHVALGLVRGDPALAERALERLGEVMHYGLRMHRDAVDRVPLRDEWDFVSSYLEIESLRLQERLKLSMEAAAETLPCLVPPFVLQPLVENAILHAVAPRKEGGRVDISARCQGGRLRLEVLDDGPGMLATPDPLAKGLGLQLLRDRLALLYEGRADLSLETREGPGLRAIIDIPLDAEGAEEWA